MLKPEIKLWNRDQLVKKRSAEATTSMLYFFAYANRYIETQRQRYYVLRG